MKLPMPSLLPSANTPLYNHPLPQIEAWLQQQGCERSNQDLHCWTLDRTDWQAEIWLDVEHLTIRYHQSGTQDVQRSFQYSLSRKDIEAAAFAGP
jgi:Protein of unknown function (DUF3143)